MKCLLTGSTGFLGPYVAKDLAASHELKTVSLRSVALSNIDFTNVEIVVHLAGKAHDMNCKDNSVYFKVNRDLTLALAAKSKECGVKQFVFVSSVKVYGDHGVSNFNEKTVPKPTDPYGQSKYEAELGLRSMETNDFVVSIVRPPLIYGSGVKGNLQNLIGLCIRLPVLPFGGIDNKRSFVYAANVSALILRIIETQTSGVFIANDGSTKSTSQLVQEISTSLENNKLLIRIPNVAKQLIKSLKPELYHRLFSDYFLDFGTTNRTLSFIPPHSFVDGIAEMVKYYQDKRLEGKL